MTPYEIGWRFRIKGRHGNIVGIKSTDPLVYLVKFDNDIVYKPTKKNPDAHVQKRREVAHSDITALMNWCEPQSNMIAVDPALFLQMRESNGAGELPTHSDHYSSSKDAKKKLTQGTAIPNPVLWNGRYWISHYGGVQHDGQGWCELPIQVFPLIPLSEYTDEIRAPSKLFEGYGGFLVECELGKFVVEDRPVTVYPSEPIYHQDEDMDIQSDRIPQVKEKSKRSATKTTKKQARVEPYQMTLTALK